MSFTKLETDRIRVVTTMNLANENRASLSIIRSPNSRMHDLKQYVNFFLFDDPKSRFSKTSSESIIEPL